MARGNRKSLVGEKFGKLLVVENKGTDNYRNSLWLCQCSCGNYTIEKGTELTTGKIIGCRKCGRYAKNPIKKEVKQADEELIGQRFGKLIIKDLTWEISKNGYKNKYAICKCDCGNEKKVLLNNLKHKQVTSCGCDKKDYRKNTLFLLSDDFIGKRFGKLVVDSYDTEKKKWKCICDCGNVTYVKKGSLTSGNTKSCGCLKYEKRGGK